MVQRMNLLMPLNHLHVAHVILFIMFSLRSPLLITLDNPYYKD